MTTALELNPGAHRAIPHVPGASTRFRSAPTKLNPLAAKVMLASGAFSTESEKARSTTWPILGAVALVLAAATICLAGDPRPDDKRVEVAPVSMAQPDTLLTLGVGDYAEPQQAVAAEPAPDLSDQDRFEIARLFHRSAAARGLHADQSGAAPLRIAAR